MVIWRAQLKFKPVGNAITIPKSKINFNNYNLWFDEKNGAVMCEVSMELDTEDEKQVQEIIAKVIEDDLLPLLTLTAGCSFEYDLNYVLLEKPNGVNISRTLKVDIETSIFIFTTVDTETFVESLKKFEESIKRLDKKEKDWLIRALKFWSRGIIDRDHVNKFINYYIAFELLVRYVLKKEITIDIIKELENKFSIKLTFDNYPVNRIRAAILHGRYKDKLVADTAIEIVRRNVDQFGGSIFTLATCLLEESLCESKSKESSS